MKKLSIFLLLAMLFLTGCAAGAEEYSEEAFAKRILDDIAEGKESAEYSFSGMKEDYIDRIDSTVQALLYNNFFCGYFTETINLTYENSFGSFTCVLEYDYNENAERINDYRGGDAAIAHDKDKFEDILEASLEKGEDDIHLLFFAEEGLTWESVEEEFKNIYGENEYFLYLSEKVTYAAYEYDDYIAFDVSVVYDDGTAPVFDAEGYGVTELALYFEEAFSTWSETIAARTTELSEEDILTAFQIAAANDSADICCEVQQVYTHAMPGKNGMITEMYAIMPVDEKTHAKYTEELKAAIEEAVMTVKNSGADSEEEILREICGIVCEKTEYSDALRDESMENEDNRSAETAVSRTAYGALVEGETVCSGYANAVKALCDELGIPCRVVCGEADDVGHAWNAVLLNGEVRYVDTTYMDTGGGDQYFLFTKDDYERDGRTELEGWMLPW